MLLILESPLDRKKIKPVNPKGNQPWIFIGSTDSEAEAQIMWSPNVKNSLIRKDPDVGKDWQQEDKGITENEMVGWYHRLTGHEFEEMLGDGEGQGTLACCGPWGGKESDTTEQLNWLADWFFCYPDQQNSGIVHKKWFSISGHFIILWTFISMQ